MAINYLTWIMLDVLFKLEKIGPIKKTRGPHHFRQPYRFIEVEKVLV
jgi:hypothetical protein